LCQRLAEQYADRKFREQIRNANALLQNQAAAREHVLPSSVPRKYELGRAPIGNSSAAVECVDQSRYSDDERNAASIAGESTKVPAPSSFHLERLVISLVE